MKLIGKLATTAFVLIVLILCWLLFSTNTTFNGRLKHLYIYPHSQDYAQQISTQLDTGNIIDNIRLFDFVARHTGVYKQLTPGRFTVKKGASVYRILQTLRHNKQDTIHFTIKRVRTIEGISEMLGRNLISDSATNYAFLSNNDSLRPFGVDTFTLNTLLIPGTYQFLWQYNLPQVLSIFAKAKAAFWAQKNRTARAAAQGLTPNEACILASIVEDETLKDSEKDTIASVYLNRLRIGMPLGADPTIEFALRNFDIQRMLKADLKVVSPYNTYIHKGLPPGPICTPDAVTVDAVLDAPDTKYLYFVAKPDFSGYHNFSEDYKTHLQYAKLFHDALDARNIK